MPKEEKRGGGDSAPKKSRFENALDSIKIVKVVRYISSLTLDLVVDGRLKKEKKDLVKRLLAMLWPDLSGKDGGFFAAGRGGRQILAMAVLALVRTYLMNRTSSMLKALSSTVYQRDIGQFREVAKGCALLTVVGSAVTSVFNYNKETLSTLWRDRLTEIVHASYFSRMAYYHAANLPGRKAIRDTDVRLSRELISVSNRLSNLISLLVTSLPPLVWFTFKLWRTRGLKFAMVPHLYLLFAYEIAQRLFPKNIGDLYRAQAFQNGKFTQAATRLRTHSESIVALGGPEREKEILEAQFGKVALATSDLNTATSKFYLVFKLAYTYGCRSWITSFMMLPTLYSPLPTAVKGQHVTGLEVATIRSVWQLMIEMLVANGNLLTLHATAEHMGGMCYRVLSMIDTMQTLQTAQSVEKETLFSEGNRIAFQNVQVYTPDKVHLVKDLNFALEPGSSLLLTGHNGAGKSSIFRCLGGLWTVPEGTITKPGASTTGLHQDIYYLPQKPYNVLGTLRDQLTYPQPRDTVNLSQSSLEALLATVNLTHLLADCDDEKDEFRNWEEQLSLGEQQRLAMARLFYFKPRFAILDECTSAVTAEMEELLYDTCKALNITFITICHRPSLKQYHDSNLNLTGDGKGGWEMLKIDHSQDPVRKARPVVEVHEVSKLQTCQTFREQRSAKYTNTVTARAMPKRSAISKLWMMIRIMVPGSRRKLLVLMGLIGLRTLCHEGYSFIVGRLFYAMSTRDVSTFALFSLLNVGQDLTTAIVEEGVNFLQNTIASQWKSSLTHHITARFFRDNAFYRMPNLDKRVKDLDQRLTMEGAELAAAFSEIWAKAISPVVDIAWFSFRLYGVLGATGMGSMLAYVVATAAVLRLAMPNHELLKSREKALESRFKFVHSRLCTHSESIAFFGGDKAEHMIADRTFRELMEHSHKMRASDARYKFVFNSVNKDFDAPANLINSPDILTAYLQLQHAIVAQGSPTLTAESFYVRSAADRSLGAFGKLTNLYESLEQLLASSTRVCEMLDVMEELHSEVALEQASSSESTSASTSAIKLEHVDIVTPNGMCLASDLSLAVSGEGLLVTGPNGYGKTSFFRVMAGLWPLPSQGQDVAQRIVRPNANDLVLVPQKVYSVTGTLADQVTYPIHIAERTAEDEARMFAALEKVGIAFLVAREKGGWDCTKQWEMTLSLGEQQRMGLARLLYHSPKYGVLDECTDAVSADAETKLYEALHDAGISCITISKRLALTEFHAEELQLGADNPNGWVLKPLHQ